VAGPFPGFRHDPRSRPRRHQRSGPADQRLDLRTLAVARDVVVLTAVGEIDLANNARFTEALAAAADRGPRLLVCDLSGIEFLACTGIAALVELRAELGARGALLRVVTTDSAVLRVLDATGERDRFAVFGDLTDALAGFVEARAAGVGDPTPLTTLRNALDEAVQQTGTLAALCGLLAEQVSAVDAARVVDERDTWTAGDTFADTVEDLRMVRNHLATGALLAAAIDDLGQLRRTDPST
jgi:anti-anti-sigma factor